MHVETVTSAQNPKIKTLLSLQEKARLRKEMGLFVVEGRRELEHCVNAGFEIDTVFYCPEIFELALTAKTESGGSLFSDNSLTLSGPSHCKQWAPPSYVAEGGTDSWRTAADQTTKMLERARQIVNVPAELYNKIAYRGGTEGIIAEVKAKVQTLDSLELSENPLVVILESVEKPGNLGAVLRSADAAGADAVIICDPLTDLYNPNLIRASIGAAFTVQTVCCSSEDAINWLKANGIKLYTAQLQDSSWYYDTDMKGATAIAIGTEATGLTDIWREAADAHIKIPMLGQLDSLNASVSAAILLFEAVRQRNA